MLDLRQKMAEARTDYAYQTATWAGTGTALTEAKNLDYATPSTPGVEGIVFVENGFTEQAVTVDVYIQETNGTTQDYLFTSFSVPAASKSAKLISHLFAGDVGVRLKLTPAAAVVDEETVQAKIREVA